MTDCVFDRANQYWENVVNIKRHPRCVMDFLLRGSIFDLFRENVRQRRCNLTLETGVLLKVVKWPSDGGPWPLPPPGGLPLHSGDGASAGEWPPAAGQVPSVRPPWLPSPPWHGLLLPAWRLPVDLQETPCGQGFIFYTENIFINWIFAGKNNVCIHPHGQRLRNHQVWSLSQFLSRCGQKKWNSG